MALEQVIYNLEEVKGLSDEELYQAMSVASKKAGVPDASDRLYQLVKEIKK